MIIIRWIVLALALPLFLNFGIGTDPYALPDPGCNLAAVGNCPGTWANNNTSYRDTSAKTLRTSQAAASYSACPILITAGQSNEGGEAQTAYTPTNASQVHNFNPFDGALYAAVDPLLGATAFVPSGSAGYGNYAGRLADVIINSGTASCIVLVPIAVGGSRVFEWAPGGTLATRLSATVGRLLNRGFTASSMFLVWGQGESDCNQGTSQTSYQSNLTLMLASIPQVKAQFVATQTWFSGAACASIEAAQAAVVNANATPPVLAGPNNDSLTGSTCSGAAACRQPDNTHFTDAGNITRAANWRAALHAFGAPF